MQQKAGHMNASDLIEIQPKSYLRIWTKSILKSLARMVYLWRAVDAAHNIADTPPSLGNTYEPPIPSKVRSRRCVIERSVRKVACRKKRPCHAVQAHRRRAENTARLDGQNMLPKLIANVKFKDGGKPASNQSCRLTQTAIEIRP
jgi:hypothetical protein